jgi:hypothetical protein
MARSDVLGGKKSLRLTYPLKTPIDWQVMTDILSSSA